MTTDPFAEAARAAAEAYARTPRMNVGTVRDRLAEAHMAGAEWGREQALAQEPTDAEVEAAAAEAYEMERCDIDPGWPDWQSADPLSKDSTRAMVRAVLRAARDVRGQG